MQNILPSRGQEPLRTALSWRDIFAHAPSARVAPKVLMRTRHHEMSDHAPPAF